MRIDGHVSRANVMSSQPLPSDKPMSVMSTSYAGLACSSNSVASSMPGRRVDRVTVRLEQGLHELATVWMILDEQYPVAQPGVAVDL